VNFPIFEDLAKLAGEMEHCFLRAKAHFGEDARTGSEQFFTIIQTFINNFRVCFNAILEF
jgi:hypothetical protein